MAQQQFVYREGATPEGKRWVLVRDAGQFPGVLRFHDFKLTTLSRIPGEQGHEAWERAREEVRHPLGEHDAQRLFNRRRELPADLRGLCLVFAGRTWKDRGGQLFVRTLEYYGEDWHLGFRWLGFGWSSYVRLVEA